MAAERAPERLSDVHRRALLAIARQSIDHGLRKARPLDVDDGAYPARLRERQASFVTLRSGGPDGALRGCTGTLDPRVPLVVDVARNAYAAAFRDPRFPPLAPAELPQLDLHISLLSPSELLAAPSEPALLAQLRPRIDGLTVEDGRHRATFLPVVWEHLPDPREFLRELKAKAGLPRDHWSAALRFSRYTVESFP